MAYYDQMTYTPTVVGRQPGYTFSRPGAKPLNLFGDAAEKLKLDIDKAKAAGPQKTASLGLDWDAMRSERDAGAATAAPMPQEPPTASDSVARNVGEVLLGPVGGNIAERITSDRPQKPAPKPAYPEPKDEQSPSERVTEALPGGQQPQTQGGVEVMPGGYYKKPGDPRIYKMSAGSAGRPGGMTPSAATMQVEGAKPVNEEFLNAYKENSVQRKLIAQDALDQNMQAAETERRAAAAGFERAQAAEKEKADLLQEQQRLMGEEETKYVKAREDFRTAKIDENRIYSGDTGTLKRIGAAVAAAAGQWGSMVSGGPNNALMIIENAIDRNIDAQKQEIETKGAEVENALNDLIRRGMSMGQAEKTLKAAQMENAAANTRYLRAQAAPGQLQNQFDTLINEMDKKTLVFEEEYRRESGGKVTQTMQSRYQAPQAASRGGEREASLKEYGQLADLTGKVLKNEKAAAGGGGQAPSDVRGMKGIASGLELWRERLQKYVPKNTNPTDEEQRLNESPLPQAKNVAGRALWETKEYLGGSGTNVRGMDPSEQVRYETFLNAQQEAMNQISILQGQGVIRGHEEKRYEAQVGSAQTFEALDRVLANIVEGANRRADAMQKAGVSSWDQFAEMGKDAEGSQYSLGE